MRGKLLDILKWVWIVAVLGGATWYFYRNYQEISGYLETISLPRIALSVFLLVISKMALSDLTRFSLKKVGTSIEYKDAFTITSITQLGKYLPGGVWHIAGKFGIYKARQLSTQKTTRALIFENTWLLSSATVIGTLFLLFSSRQMLCEFNALFCQSGINWMIALLLPVLWISALIIFEKAFFKDSPWNPKDFVFTLLEMLVVWISFGISFWLVFPIHSGFLPAITGAFALSWLAGYVAFFAPGGIGIREYLLTLILATFFSSSEVAIYATIHRLIWVLVEIILGAGSALIFGIPMTANGDAANETR